MRGMRGLWLGTMAASCVAWLKMHSCTGKQERGTATKGLGGTRNTRKPWAEAEDKQLLAKQLVDGALLVAPPKQLGTYPI